MNPPDAERARAMRKRLLERHASASIRALGEPAGDLRSGQVRLAGRPASLASPQLAADFETVALARSRGVADSIGLRLAFSDFTAHRAREPEGLYARLVFDVLEQLRCESLAPVHLPGVRANLDAAFAGWCDSVHAGDLTDSEAGLLLYTLIHIVRARLIGSRQDDTAEALTETTRGALAPLLGHSLYRLKSLRGDQAAYAGEALQIAEVLAARAGEQDIALEDARPLAGRIALALPPDWFDALPDRDGVAAGAGAAASGTAVAPGESLDTLGGYHVYRDDWDVECSGESLARDARRRELRQRLDAEIATQRISVTRLAAELQALFADPVTDGRRFNREEGRIDARRLAQLVANPDYRGIFTDARPALRADSVVTFLLDCSGSMKRQRQLAMAVLVDAYCRALDLAGVRSEVLGFTTADWNGGRALRSWQRDGRPQGPGRLGERLHIRFKEADQRWRQARKGLATLLETRHMREGIDGEALIWAYRRLLLRPERRRYLVMVSDGAPMDAATVNHNPEGFLHDHLAAVAQRIDADPRVTLAGIGVDLDLSALFVRHAHLDLRGTPGPAAWRVLHRVFG